VNSGVSAAHDPARVRMDGRNISEPEAIPRCLELTEEQRIGCFPKEVCGLLHFGDWRQKAGPRSQKVVQQSKSSATLLRRPFWRLDYSEDGKVAPFVSHQLDVAPNPPSPDAIISQSGSSHND
jgi:hypothetical protein